MTTTHISPDLGNLRRIAAFSSGHEGGNPAGVLITDHAPNDSEMQAIAAEVGYSETAFASPDGEHWRVRYFSPEGEVDFCGHATIALGRALSDLKGPARYDLRINAGDISVASHTDDSGKTLIELQSPPTRSGPAEGAVLAEALALFDLSEEDLDPALPPAIANAGNDHLVLALRQRDRLARMEYDLADGRRLMERHGLTTINLIVAGEDALFLSRNAFAIGGVLEDPATGAAAAALAGYLRDIDWPLDWAPKETADAARAEIRIEQGDDMGVPSRLRVSISPEKGAPVAVSGQARDIA